jgi:hypothetical protein
MKITTIREVIYWEYSKLIAEKISGSRTDYAQVTGVLKRLVAGKIKMSSILRENKLLVNADKKCTYCGCEAPLQWEHIIPLSRGGPDHIDNLVLSCRTCNLSKGTKNPFEWYGKPRRAEIPRIVVGKYLKLAFDRHQAAGTLELECTRPEGRMKLADLMTAFDEAESRMTAI